MQGMDMKKMKLVEGGAKEETKQILQNLDTVLQAANSSMKQVTLCSVSLVNISRDFKDMNEAYATFWPKDPPARVAVQVAALAGNASVEIQCNAALNDKNRTTVSVPSLPDPSSKGKAYSFCDAKVSKIEPGQRLSTVLGHESGWNGLPEWDSRYGHGHGKVGFGRCAK
eukprot:symbB.v1.2.003569.t1/scaffold204.1/size273638/18